MFLDSGTWFGVPVAIVPVILAGILWCIGFLWLRASLPGEPHPHSFRATSPKPLSNELRLGVLGVVLAIAAMVLALGVR